MKNYKFKHVAVLSALALTSSLFLSSMAVARDGTLISNPGPAMNSSTSKSAVNTAPLTEPVTSRISGNDPNRVDITLEDNRNRTNEPNTNYYLNNRAPGHGNSSLDDNNTGVRGVSNTQNNQ